MRIRSKKELKYFLYENTVQSPNWQVDYLPQFHTWLTRRAPKIFREDFCGSARIACEWVKRDTSHQAIGLDLDSQVLSYARTVNRNALTEEQKKRMHLKRQDVRKKTSLKIDWIGAFNYSVFTFHERDQLLKYFRSAYQSLQSKGTLFLEIAGGPGFLKPFLQKKTNKIPGVGSVTQVWEQQEYDPIRGLNAYAIHFQLPDRTWLKDAFIYHWRVWSIPEIRDALREAGFQDSIVLWEKSAARGQPSNEYLPCDSAPHEDFYVCYVIGVKKA